ncbi:hypothetical protein ACFL14_02100 [Patescibacteria group bacterium]
MRYICPLADNGEGPDESTKAWVHFNELMVSEDGRPYRDMNVLEAVELIPLLKAKNLFSGVSEIVTFEPKDGYPRNGVIRISDDVVLVIDHYHPSQSYIRAKAYADSIEVLSEALLNADIKSRTHEYDLTSKRPKFRGVFQGIKNMVNDSWESVIISFGLGLLLGIGVLWVVTSLVIQ